MQSAKIRAQQIQVVTLAIYEFRASTQPVCELLAVSRESTLSVYIIKSLHVK